jgi:pimeloyl-[acyl-carrier protein] synthase
MESLDDGLAAEQDLIGALFGRDGRRDPHALIRSVSLPGCRHATANAILRDPRLVPPPVASTAPLFRMFSRWLISLDGERHRRVRRQIGGLFTPRRVEGFRALVQERAATVLDRLEAAGQMDLVTEFARPLPFSVIVEILGVPPDRHEFLGARLLTMGQGFANQRDPAFLERANAAVTELLEYFGGLLDERAQDPREDLLSILAADIPDDEHGRDDLVANCIFFVEAGHATTTSLISIGTLLLLQNPAELDTLRAEPALLPGAIEEMLRLASPVSVVPRHAREELELDACHYDPGSTRYVFLGAANRDPEVFQDPDRFDVRRAPEQQLAFAAGRHFCLGAPLARLHGEVAIGSLLRRLPELSLAGEPVWRGSIPLRELEHLPVAWRKSPPRG